MTYWDPIPTVRAAAEQPWRGRWEERDWRNVPGPFYGAETDTCLTGRLEAPGHVLYEDTYGQEFVYRQPLTEAEARAVLWAAEEEAFEAYGRDGDAHWTPDSVREWWRDRARVREWAFGMGWGAWATSDHEWRRDNAAGARDYVAHLDGGLAGYLRGYVFWLAEGRPARADEALPRL
ncbi:ferredoxin [Streptomyces sp. NPDC003042]